MANDIPELRLSVLQKLIERFTTNPALLLTNMFGSDNWDSEEIKWEAQMGNRGMAPFSSEDAPAPRTAPAGVSEHEALAAFWSEKMYFGANFLNNLRQPGTTATHHRASAYLARQLQMLRNRSDRRKEWMYAKMLSEGGFTYVDHKQNKVSVDYGIPAAHQVTLAADRQWDDGASKNIVEDIMDAVITMKNANSAQLDYALATAEIVKLMVLDSGIQNLLKKSAFGEGDLFGPNKLSVLGSLLEIKNIIQYDDAYQARAWLTAALAAGAGPHTIYVDDTTDFEVGGTLVVTDISAKTTEEVTVTAVDAGAGTVTATGALSNAYKATEDTVHMTKKYLGTDKFLMFASTVEGQQIAEFAKAPFSIDRVWGMKVDQWDKKDPEGVYVRAQNKGLPVLYFEDSTYCLTVV